MRHTAVCPMPRPYAVLRPIWDGPCDMIDSTRALRLDCRRRRRDLHDVQRCAAEAAITAAVSEQLDGTAAVGAYLATDGEVDLLGVIAVCRQREIAVAVPRVAGRDMTFAPLAAETPTIRNRFDIEEPGPNVPDWPLTTFSFVLAPVVAFDDAGNRLGRGGGFYDRCFAAPDAPPLVGVAFECQRIRSLPAKPHDVALTAVVTEAGWQDCRA